MPLPAEIEKVQATTDQRGYCRRTLRLRVEGELSLHATEAIICNLSEQGLLLESTTELTVGERLHVELPGSGMRSAIVVWNRDHLYGCEFPIPITNATVSAMLLRAPAESIVQDGEMSETPISPVDRWESGTLLVTMVSLVVLFLVAIVFLEALFPPAAR